MDDENGTGIPPDDEPVEAAPATPEPSRPAPPPLEAFLGYRQRVKSDADGYIGSAMLDWSNTLPEAERERLESDVDFFNASWDRFEAARPPRPASPPQPQTPPAPVRYEAPAWKVAQWEREAGRTTQRFDALTSLPPSVAEMEGAGERRETEKHNREINSIRQRVKAGDKDAEVDLAQALGLGNLGKPSWGPERY